MILFTLPYLANAQIGMDRSSIVSFETSNNALLKENPTTLHYISDNINTYYYFNGANCNYIVKMTFKSAIAKLKMYLNENKYSYDAENNSYVNGNSRAHLIYQGIFVGLKIYPNEIIPAELHASK